MEVRCCECWDKCADGATGWELEDEYHRWWHICGEPRREKHAGVVLLSKADIESPARDRVKAWKTSETGDGELYG